LFGQQHGVDQPHREREDPAMVDNVETGVSTPVAPGRRLAERLG
jgi:hypothetical protein